MVKEREHDKQKGTIVGYGTCQNPWPRFYIPNNEEMSEKIPSDGNW